MGVLRAAMRFAASVLVVSGVLLVADVAVTLAWQEPITALMASRAQDDLERQLEGAEAAAGGAWSRRDVRRRAAAYGSSLRTGRAFGRIELPTLERDYVIAHGTDAKTLRKGPAHYPDTGLPGEGGTVGVAGHRTTYLAPFRTIDQLERGDPIVVTMPYGRFTYRVEGTRIVKPHDVWVTRDVGRERLMLSACHPVYSAEERIVVFARLAGVEPPESSVLGSRELSQRIASTSRPAETASTASQ